MEMIASRNTYTDPLVDSSTTRSVTTVSMEHAVPELKITAEVCHCLFYLFIQN